MAPTERPGVEVDERIDERVDPTLDDGDHERFAHIVRRSELTDAMVFGKEITALCGKKWIPTRDPEKFPVCPDCRDRLAAMP
jgi:hypothetical protein